MNNISGRRKKNKHGGRKGIGMDMQAVSDFPRYGLKSRERFYRMRFTNKEIVYCAAKADPRQHFAVRLAGKNATRHALGDQLLDRKEIEIINEEDGHPVVRVGSTEKKVIISLSHTDTYAIAIAIWQR